MPKPSLKNIGLYFITDSGLTKKGIFSDVRLSVAAGVRVVQYREKGISHGRMIKEASKIADVCRKLGAIFIVNDFPEVAKEVKADGVHIGREDLSYSNARKILGNKRIIGVTVHSLGEALEAQSQGADYIGISPVFDTATKKDAGRGMGTEKLAYIVNAVKIPCIAIGGINEANISAVARTGVDGIAVISAIATKDDVKEAAKKLIEGIKKSI